MAKFYDQRKDVRGTRPVTVPAVTTVRQRIDAAQNPPKTEKK